jgi:hypothetical protein
MAGAALVAGLHQQPLLAQSQTNEDEIVVEGVRDRDREIERFVGALTEAPMRGQISRFDWEVCPAVAGLPDAQAEAIVERMRKVAEAADIPLADPGCAPNALVIATPDRAATLRWLRREYPAYFRDGLDRRIDIPDDEEPATAWQIESRLDEDGRPVAVNLIDRTYVVDATRSPSRLTAATRPHFLASVLVVQLDALAGLSTTQVADYAAMRVFARTDPSRLARTSAPTILTVLDADMNSEISLSMTQWDLAFLRALYGSAENHYATQQRGEMRRILEQQLDQARQ